MVRKWEIEKCEELKACFEGSDKSSIIENDIDINTNLDLSSMYFHFCFEMIVLIKKVKINPNNKPWDSKEIKTILGKKIYIL